MTAISRPTVLPDELDFSYLGRIMRINRFHSVKEAVSAMVRRFAMTHLNRRERSCLELLSLTADKSIEEFAQQHSTIPLRRAITSSLPNLIHGSSSRRTLLCNFGMVAVRNGAYFCVTCAKEDLAKYGVGYWHREHQIPGQLWCRSHLVPLSYMTGGDAFLRCTTTFIEHADVTPIDLVDVAINSARVQRYMDVVFGLISRALPLDVKFVARALRQQALKLGLNTVAAPVRNKPLLSDLIADSFPAHWLVNVAPSLVGKEKGQILNRVDGVLYLATSASSVWSYVLAATVLYESADEALKGLESAQADFSGEPRRKRREHEKLDTKEVSTLYVECKGRHTLVAKRLSVPLHRVSAILRAVGLPNLVGERAKLKNFRAAAEAFHIQEKSFDESAKIGGLTALEMSSLLRTSGIHFKSTLTAMTGRKIVCGTGVKRTKGFMPRETHSIFGAPLGKPDKWHDLGGGHVLG